MKAQVYVAGSGVLSAIGNSVTATLNALKNSASGIGQLTGFETAHRNFPVGEVRLSNRILSEILEVSFVYPRTALLGLHAAREAVADAQIDLKKWRTGLISATTVGGMDKTEHFFTNFYRDPHKGKLQDVVNHGCGKTTEIIAADLRVRDYITTINTACSSSANAIAFAARLIEADVLDAAIAGGVDALTAFTLNGFNSLMILDTQPCKPFDANRNGLNLGEGAGYVVLVSQRVMEKENLSPKNRLSGFANTNDAFHQTASSPEGRGSFAAMQNALAMAGLDPDSIDYINLHGTGTVNNDLSEGTAVQRLFSKTLPRMSSTKSFTGHTLGASGGIEAVISLLSIDHQCVFPNLGFENAIPEIGIIPQRNFEDNLPIKHVMSNSFGFGGNCSSILFSKN